MNIEVYLYDFCGLFVVVFVIGVVGCRIWMLCSVEIGKYYEFVLVLIEGWFFFVKCEDSWFNSIIVNYDGNDVIVFELVIGELYCI